MSKDQWIADVERILEDYASEEIDTEDAADRLANMGFGPYEIQDMLRNATA